MKINQDELFAQVRHFLQRKGIELQEGTYTRTIQKSCQVLADTINLGQQAIASAKTELERTLDQARQAIHKKTAPPQPPVHKQAKPRAARSARKPPGPSEQARAKSGERPSRKGPSKP